ncbi:MAG TPA: pantoate--beta-alanine ligase [Thermoanaerobaculia bacterium]|jgi:pantoate--beta-alanine ligase|nr:pantoate--beta-alanine ligase [Thermoanaerobaculia bacterium]
MITVRTAQELGRERALWQATDREVAFVPTMGALHQGHISLIRIARERAERVVASVFVNPTQFAANEDLSRYPRQPEKDAEMLAAAGCDVLFLPDVDTIYPPGHTAFVEPGGPAEGLEGAFRPGHFRGVATVVLGLFNLVRPDVAVFGKKDAQQVAVVRQMVRDLHVPVEVVAAETVREPDGLAMSSRNVYLAPDERCAAAVLHRALVAAEQAIAGGERRGDAVRNILRRVLESEPLARIEYAEAVDGKTFQPLDVLCGQVVLPLAVRIGGTRLIDNFQLAVVEQESCRERC